MSEGKNCFEKTKEYTNPIMITSQFHMCGNCFRADTYKGCDFGCKYCFANSRHDGKLFGESIARIQLIEKWFKDAIEKGEENNIKKEMLKHYVPLHLGGMSDPFQKREWKHGITKRFLEISNKYNYPINISTKTSYLPDEYWNLLNPEIHTFQISLIGVSDEYIRKFETNTPLASERIKFVKELKSRGFWVSIRIQPIIDINEVLELIKLTENYVDYYTIEHLKIARDSTNIQKTMLHLIENMNVGLVAKFREYEFDSNTIYRNIQKIKNATNVKIGCGDNAFHIMSDSFNCCGVDTMPTAFNNWMKYNTMYIKMTGDRNVWFPKRTCNGVFNSKLLTKGLHFVNEYVEEIYPRIYGDDRQQILF